MSKAEARSHRTLAVFGGGEENELGLSHGRSGYLSFKAVTIAGEIAGETSSSGPDHL
jgi:hypothetical protein